MGMHCTVNSAFVKKNSQGEDVIHLGGDLNQENYLDLDPGWNAAIRIDPSSSLQHDPVDRVAERLRSPVGSLKSFAT